MKKGVYLLSLVLLLPFVFASSHETIGAGSSLDAGIDDTKPTVTVLDPADGDILSGEKAVRAIATDNVGVDLVEFVLDGVVVYTSVTPTPEGVYEWIFDTTLVEDGLHALVVAPYDASGNFNDLTTIQVTVANAPSAVLGGPGDSGEPALFPDDAQQSVLPSASPSAPQAVPSSAPRSSVPSADSSVKSSARQTLPRANELPVEEERAPQASASENARSLWLTLLMSFGVIAVVSTVLVLGIQKLRSPSPVPDHIKMYVYASMQQGYPTTSIRSVLLQQGWDDKVIDEALKDAIGKNPEEVGF